MSRRVNPAGRSDQVFRSDYGDFDEGKSSTDVETQVEKMARVLLHVVRYAIVIGDAAVTDKFQRIDLCISMRGMTHIKLLDKEGDLRVFGNEDRGSINTPVPIYLWGDGDGPSRYLRLAMSDTMTATLFGIRMRAVPGEPAKPVKEEQ